MVILKEIQTVHLDVELRQGEEPLAKDRPWQMVDAGCMAEKAQVPEPRKV